MNVEAIDLTRVVIINGDTRVPTDFTIHCSRLAHLKQLIHQVGQSDVKLPEPWGEGVDSTSVVGMSVLFEVIPQKFPVQSILLWLRDEYDPSLPLPVVEHALGQLARLYV